MKRHEIVFALAKHIYPTSFYHEIIWWPTHYLRALLEWYEIKGYRNEYNFDKMPIEEIMILSSKEGMITDPDGQQTKFNVLINFKNSYAKQPESEINPYEDTGWINASEWLDKKHE